LLCVVVVPVAIEIASAEHVYLSKEIEHTEEEHDW